MRLNLTQLVILTCVALAGIVSLQTFWLIKTYKEKREQLIASANNIMTETHLLSGVSPAISNIAPALIKSIGEMEVIGPGDSVMIAIQETYQTTADTNIKPPDSIAGHNMVDNVLAELLKNESFTLQSYKHRLEKAFSSRKVEIPALELALLNTKGDIIASTIDTVKYRNIKIRSSTGNTFQFNLPVQLNKNLSGYLEIGFPSGASFLLKDMAVVLLLSLIFILVCCFSFGYMVAYFFKEKRLAEFRNNFMNNMTHELKTPISSASLALELLQDESVPVSAQKRSEYFEAATGELSRLAMLVDKVLKIAAYENEKIVLHNQTFEVKPWVTQVIRSSLPAANTSPAVDLKLIISPPGLSLWGDQEHLSGLLQNLLENAVKYKNKDQNTLIIKVEITDEKDYFMIRVSDNGMGIAPMYLEKIFDKFFRVPTGDQHNTKGYGLGLSYVQEITRLHQGSLSVESVLKRGTTFTITLPKKTVK